MENGTGLAIFGAALGSADIMGKVLGPTAEYLGTSLKDFTQKRIENIGNIINIAASKLGDRIDLDGQVSPRVIKAVLDEGGFCDDPLIAEYFGGILASSRSEQTRDDRGAYFLSLLKSLTSYQLRAHYLFYSLMRRLYIDQKVHVKTRFALREQSLLIDLHDFSWAMDFQKDEMPISLIFHALAGLERESLIGNLDTEQEDVVRQLTDTEIIVIPTLAGIELFLWGHGKGHIQTHRWLSSKYSYDLFSDISEVDGSAIDITKHL